MNLAGLVAATRRKVGVNAGDGMLTPEVLADLVDEANTMLEAERDWPWRMASATFSTVTGQQAYAAAAFAPAGNWLRTAGLRVATYGPMTLRSYGDLDTRNPSGGQGLPWEFAFYGDTMLLSPVPDGVYSVTHRYVAVAAALTADEDLPAMPAMFHRAIVQQATALAFQRVGDDDRAQLAEAAVDRWRARMLDDQRRSMGSLQVKVRPGSAL